MSRTYLNKIDALVAEHVMDYKPNLDDYYGVPIWERPDSGDIAKSAWQPTEKIDQMMLCLNQFPGDFEIKRRNGYFDVTLYVPSMQYNVFDKTLGLAVCKTLLRWKGVDFEK